jgi:hypothetical protein
MFWATCICKIISNTICRLLLVIVIDSAGLTKQSDLQRGWEGSCWLFKAIIVDCRLENNTRAFAPGIVNFILEFSESWTCYGKICPSRKLSLMNALHVKCFPVSHLLHSYITFPCKETLISKPQSHSS